MLYNPPPGSTNANAPYVGKNVAAGTQGSKIPPKAIENTQREIVNAISGAGLAPTNDDLTQLLQAMRSIAQTAAGSVSGAVFWRYGQDVSTNPALLTADVTPNMSGYDTNGGYRIRVNNGSVSGGTQANLENVGQRPVVRADGTPIRKGDWTKGQVILLLDDGTNLQLAGVTTAFAPSSNIVTFITSGTFTVPAGVTALKRPRGWAPGGGGGGSTGSGGAGSGGGGGGYFELPSVAVSPGDVVVATIGARGAGGNAAAGSAGGTISLGLQGQAAWAAATGGGGGGAGLNGVNNSSAGDGGVGSGPGLNVAGGKGSFGLGYSGGQVGSGIGGGAAFGGGAQPTPNLGIGATDGNFPGGGANGGCGGSNGGTAGGGLITFEY